VWEYRNAYKRSTGQTPFKLVYGQDAIIPLHFWENAETLEYLLRYDLTLNKKEHFYQLNKLEEERILALHHREF
jgi:hypothetical protein